MRQNRSKETVKKRTKNVDKGGWEKDKDNRRINKKEILLILLKYKESAKERERAERKR